MEIENTDIQILHEYKTFLKINRSSSDKTIATYIKDINSFFLFLNISINNVEKLSQINNNDIKKWLFTRKQKVSNRTISRQIVSIKMFFLFLKEVKNISNNCILNMNGLKFKDNLPKAIPEDIITDIINNYENIANQKDKFIIERDKLIITTLYTTGIRISELLSLKNEDFCKDEVKIVGKGNKERIIFITPIIRQQYISYRNELKKINITTTNNIVFFKKNKKPMSIRDIGRVFQNIKINKNLQYCSPHVMRHSFATTLLSNGANIKQIQTLLGHENLATTQKYTKITEKLLEDKLKKVKW